MELEALQSIFMDDLGSRITRRPTSMLDDLFLEITRSGELCFDPGDHVRCGHCDYGMLLCACRSVPHCMDLVLKSLPPPEIDAEPETLLQRFTSCVDQSVTMGSFDTATWYDEHRDRTCDALRERGRALDDMVAAYAATLPYDAALPHLVRRRLPGSPGLRRALRGPIRHTAPTRVSAPSCSPAEARGGRLPRL